MMNLSMSHPVPTFGDALTVTCYVCGMPSSKEWAQKARSRPTTPMKPYYPFLLQLSPPCGGGACLREDGSTYLCAFCHASLEAQWIIYESQQVIPPPNRKYNIQKFICAVCGVETYRKRIRALPFQEFPFLEKQRQPGSITLGNNPLAVVCLDCSETLWAQSAEYDRWGLPVQKRHFNWMARPPPPEDSVEATVARLPSGETQLPRCPPIEPSLTPSTSKAAGGGLALEPPSPPVMIPSTSKRSTSKEKGCSPKLHHHPPHDTSSPSLGGGGGVGGRKVSLTSTTPPSSANLQDFQPPVVTVAPMSSTSTVISLQRKESLGLPPGLTLSHHVSPHSHHHQSPHHQHHHSVAPPPGIYPAPPGAASGTGIYPTATYPYATMWANPHHPSSPRGEPNTAYSLPYPSTSGGGGPPDGGGGPPTGAWPPPWLPHPSTDLLRYQSYVNSLQTRSRLIESSQGRSSPQGGAGGYGSPPETQITRVAPSQGSPSENSQAYPSGGKGIASPVPSSSSSQGKKSPRSSAGPPPPSSSCTTAAVTITPISSAKVVHSPKKGGSSTAPVSSSSPRGKSSSPGLPPPPPPQNIQEDGNGSTDNLSASGSRRECHIPKKRNWQVFMKESQLEAGSSSSSPPPTEVVTSTSMPQHPKKKKSLTICSSEAMDLSGTTPQQTMSSSSKFRIEFLCQSDQGAGADADAREAQDDMSAANQHISVIRVAPKGAPTPPPAMQMEGVEEEDEEMEGMEGISKVSSQDKVEEEEGKGKDLSKVESDDDGGDKGNGGRDLEGDGGNEGKSKKELIKSKRRRKKDEKKLEDSTNLNELVEKRVEVEVENEVEDELLKLGPNLEQFLKDTVSQLVARDKEKGEKDREERNEQTEFLEGLGLVTPDKKIDVELKKILSRHERKTLPPLKLRVEGDKEGKIGRKLRELLLKVSLEGGEFEGEDDGQEKMDFMKELGMKTAQREEKNKRELKWRVILMERIRRELRGGCGARGVKHEWEKGEDGLFMEKFGGDLDKFLDNLASMVVQQAEEEEEEEEEKSKEGKGGLSPSGGGGGVCINYPKYIPSYQVVGAGGQGDQAILKIPVVAVSSSEEIVAIKEEEKEEEISPGGKIEGIIEKSGKFWEEMKGVVNEVVQGEGQGQDKWRDEEEKRSSIDKLYKHVKLQLGEMRDLEKTLKAKISGRKGSKN